MGGYGQAPCGPRGPHPHASPTLAGAIVAAPLAKRCFIESLADAAARASSRSLDTLLAVDGGNATGNRRDSDGSDEDEDDDEEEDEEEDEGEHPSVRESTSRRNGERAWRRRRRREVRAWREAAHATWTESPAAGTASAQLREQVARTCAALHVVATARGAVPGTPAGSRTDEAAEVAAEVTLRRSQVLELRAKLRYALSPPPPSPRPSSPTPRLLFAFPSLTRSMRPPRPAARRARRRRRRGCADTAPSASWTAAGRSWSERGTERPPRCRQATGTRRRTAVAGLPAPTGPPRAPLAGLLRRQGPGRRQTGVPRLPRLRRVLRRPVRVRTTATRRAATEVLRGMHRRRGTRWFVPVLPRPSWVAVHILPPTRTPLSFPHHCCSTRGDWRLWSRRRTACRSLRSRWPSSSGRLRRWRRRRSGPVPRQPRGRARSTRPRSLEPRWGPSHWWRTCAVERRNWRVAVRL